MNEIISSPNNRDQNTFLYKIYAHSKPQQPNLFFFKNNLFYFNVLLLKIILKNKKYIFLMYF